MIRNHPRWHVTSELDIKIKCRCSNLDRRPTLWRKLCYIERSKGLHKFESLWQAIADYVAKYERKFGTIVVDDDKSVSS
jgi:hypothetical protein